MTRNTIVLLVFMYLLHLIRKRNHVMRAGLFLYITSQCQCTTNFCGPKRDRTDDLLNANQALSQLSYGPIPSTPGG